MQIDAAGLRAATIGLVAGGLLVGAIAFAAGPLNTEERCVGIAAAPSSTTVTGREWLGMLADGWVVERTFPSNAPTLWCMRRSRFR